MRIFMALRSPGGNSGSPRNPRPGLVSTKPTKGGTDPKRGGGKDQPKGTKPGVTGSKGGVTPGRRPTGKTGGNVGPGGKGPNYTYKGGTKNPPGKGRPTNRPGPVTRKAK